MAGETQTTSDDDFVSRLTSSQGELRALVLGLTPTRADADDVLQEVNVALWQKRQEYDPTRGFCGWACGFVLMEIRKFRKKKSRSRLWFSDLAMETLANTWTENTSGDDDRREALGGCLKKLGTDERQCIAMYYGGQLSGPEIAEHTGKPLSTVYKILTRSRRMLRKCIDRTLGQAQHACAVLVVVYLHCGNA